MTDKNDSKLLESLEMTFLLIPPPNRRHLHLLLRFFSKIIENKKINLDFNENISTKDYVII